MKSAGCRRGGVAGRAVEVAVHRGARHAEQVGDLLDGLLPASYCCCARAACSGLSLGLRPPTRPRARAAARPSWVLASVSSRCSSASTLSMGVVVAQDGDPGADACDSAADGRDRCQEVGGVFQGGGQRDGGEQQQGRRGWWRGVDQMGMSAAVVAARARVSRVGIAARVRGASVGSRRSQPAVATSPPASVTMATPR